MRLVFTPEHVKEFYGKWRRIGEPSGVDWMTYFQQVFDAWLEARAVVHSYNNGHHSTMSHWYFDSIVDTKQGATHRARLACIEALEPEPCKHEPQVFVSRDMESWYLAGKPKPDFSCKTCGVKLKAKWEEA